MRRWRLNLAVGRGGPAVESWRSGGSPDGGVRRARLIGTAGQKLGMCRGNRETKACPGVLG